MAPSPSDAQKGAIAGAAGAAITDFAVGLERAAAVAGDILTGIFGALPWNLTGQETAQAVNETAGVVVPVLPDAVGVVG